MIKFESQYEEGSTKVQIELSSDSELLDVIQAFESFLKATGYNFAGQIDIIYNEEN